MEYKRKIFPEEVALIAFLASKAQFQLESNWENKFIAYPLTKEKIGSIWLLKITRNILEDKVEFFHVASFMMLIMLK